MNLISILRGYRRRDDGVGYYLTDDDALKALQFLRRYHEKEIHELKLTNDRLTSKVEASKLAVDVLITVLNKVKLTEGAAKAQEILKLLNQ